MAGRKQVGFEPVLFERGGSGAGAEFADVKRRADLDLPRPATP